jgi:hypothetical protein
MGSKVPPKSAMFISYSTGRCCIVFRPRVSLDSRNPEFWSIGDIHRLKSLYIQLTVVAVVVRMVSAHPSATT